MKCAQSAPLIRISGRTAAINSRGVSSSKNVTASTAASAEASSARWSSEISGRVGTFQPLDAGVGVQRQDQDVAERSGGFEQPDVAGMQDVVTAVGEDDLLAGALPFGARGDQFLS